MSSGSAVSYVNFGGVDGEYNMRSDQASRFHLSHMEQGQLRRGSGSGSQLEHVLGRIHHWESPSSSREALNFSQELDQFLKHSRQKVDQSPPLNYASDHNRERWGSSPRPVPPVTGSRSAVASPVSNSLHQAPPLSYAEQNGYAPPLYNDGRCTPLLSRTPPLHKLHKGHHHSDTDPHQGASPPGQESHPVLSRAERMAALERRMKANGLSAPGRPRSSLGQKRLGQASASHVGAVQMNEGTTTSGSESSESEVENRAHCSSPLVFGNPVEVNPPIPRSKFSFGSLQLDDEADEDVGHAFSDEDGGQIFSC